MYKLAAIFPLLTLLALPLYAQPEVSLIDVSGQTPELSALDRTFISERLTRLDTKDCETRVLRKQPRLLYRRLTLQRSPQPLIVDVADDVMRTGNMVIYVPDGNEWREYYGCPEDILLPTLAIIATAKVAGPEIGSNRIRQEVLAHNTLLSSHEASELQFRNDSDDAHTYMDFTLSLKHPLFANLAPFERLQETGADVLEALIPGDEEFFMQLYIAFSGRFSQYIGTRESSPVVARRFNPSLFYRVWTSEQAWFDFGLGHESNGQRINNQAAFLREQEDYRLHGEDAVFARDSLSRGWDYTFFDWQRAWNERWISHLQFRHFLNDGPLQGKSEEYNTWEDGGTQLRPRSQYDGVRASLQYNFNRSQCFIGSWFICFKQFEITQETGYSAMFANNSTTLEFTTDFFGLPVQLWGRSGYNSDLVDYYRYSNSFGLGIELKTP